MDAIGEVHQVTSSFNLSVHDGYVICGDLGKSLQVYGTLKTSFSIGQVLGPNLGKKHHAETSLQSVLVFFINAYILVE